ARSPLRAAGPRQLCRDRAADARRPAEAEGLSGRVRRLRRDGRGIAETGSRAACWGARPGRSSAALPAMTTAAPEAIAAHPLLRRLRSELERLYGDRLERVRLYGSRARGDARPDSDWDVAVILEDYDGR